MTTTRQALTGALASAAATAGNAPSIHNTQPWRWRIHDGVADLRADLRRHLAAADPRRHMLLVSCGAALHHAKIALAAEGYACDVVYLPDARDPELLARVSAVGDTSVTPAAVRLVQTMAVRHTDRRPLADVALPDGAVEALRAAAALYGTSLDLVRPDRVVDLAAAVSRGQLGVLADPDARAEIEYWTSGVHPDGTGLPDAVIPAVPPPTTVPGRDFGRPGTLAVPAGHDGAARYAVLSGINEEPATWLRAGEALSALWLAATELSVAVLPLSAPVESPAARRELRRVTAGVGYPLLVLRLGVVDPDRPPAARTARLAASETVEVVGAQPATGPGPVPGRAVRSAPSGGSRGRSSAVPREP